MPETAQRLLNEIYKNGGIMRISIHGPNLPRAVPYGPGKGAPIEENRDLLIEMGGQAFELCVKVGRIRLELESEEFLEGLKAACERALPFPSRSNVANSSTPGRPSPTMPSMAAKSRTSAF